MIGAGAVEISQLHVSIAVSCRQNSKPIERKVRYSGKKCRVWQVLNVVMGAFCTIETRRAFGCSRHQKRGSVARVAALAVKFYRGLKIFYLCSSPEAAVGNVERLIINPRRIAAHGVILDLPGLWQIARGEQVLHLI